MSPQPTDPTRRDFGLLLAVGVTIPSLAGASAAREKEKPRAQDEALLAIVRARYGKHLTAEQLEKIHQRLKSAVTRGEELKRVPLTNADDPIAAFRADLP
jgi:hypothetical protein